MSGQRMNSPTDQPQSLAAKASWFCLGLGFGCSSILLLFLVVDQTLSPFDQTRHGVLTGFLPRTVLFVLWAGEALAAVVGIGSFMLIRREDITSKAIGGIVARSLGGIVVGSFGVLFLWLYVGHRVIGF